MSPRSTNIVRLVELSHPPLDGGFLGASWPSYECRYERAAMVIDKRTLINTSLIPKAPGLAIYVTPGVKQQQTIDMIQAPPSRLLTNLPPEILFMILQQCFEGASISITRQYSLQDAQWHYKRYFRDGSDSIMLTCKSLYEASVPAVLKAADFDLVLSTLGEARSWWLSQPISLAENVRRISASLSFAKHLQDAWGHRMMLYRKLRQLTIYARFDPAIIPWDLEDYLTHLGNFHTECTARGVDLKYFLTVLFRIKKGGGGIGRFTIDKQRRFRVYQAPVIWDEEEDEREVMFKQSVCQVFNCDLNILDAPLTNHTRDKVWGSSQDQIGK